MFKYLESLRAKPESERRRAVLWISITITAIIFIIWGVALGMRMNAGSFSFKNTNIDASSTAPDISNIGSSFSNFWKGITGATTTQ
jgi:hypothetical protein